MMSFLQKDSITKYILIVFDKLLCDYKKFNNLYNV